MVWAAYVLASFIPVNAASQLYFPRTSLDTGTLTGIAFVNPNAQAAQVRLTAYGTDGNLISGPGVQNPVDVEIPPRRQLAKLLDQFFGGSFPTDQAGWMLASSTADGVTGFFLHLNTTITLFDGSDLPETSRKIVFNQVREGNGYTTELSIFNPGDKAVTAEVDLVRDGQPALGAPTVLTLPPKGLTRLQATDLFGLEEIPAASHLILTASDYIGGFEFVRTPAGELFGLNARPIFEALSTLYFPQIAVLGPWKTTLNLVNYVDSPAIVSVSAMKPDGTLHSGEYLKGANPVVLAIGPGQGFSSDLADLFGFESSTGKVFDGWLKVETSVPSINGFLSYGLPGTGSIAAVTAQPKPQKYAFFSHIAMTEGYFTGLALLNSGAVASGFRVKAYSGQGQVIGSFDGLLKPGERISKVLNELISGTAGVSGGFVSVVSDQPLFMTSLFGTVNVLANVPPQEAPAYFEKNSGDPRLEVNPKLAVVPTSGTFQFTAPGAVGAPAWKVQDIAGGAPEIGSISSAGIYAAPGASPTRLPVAVSAEDSNRVGAATVDVLNPVDVLSGQDHIQALAYLQSQRKLYSAELRAASTSGRAHQPRMQTGANSTRIYGLLPGAKFELLSLPGEEVSKMIPFPASNQREYLLLAARTGGKILRVDPLTRVSKEVIRGLDAPTALVMDPVTGNLLVAERTQVRSFPRAVLESDLGTASGPAALGTGLSSTLVIDGLNEPVGLAVDACTGKIYISDGSGVILEHDPITAVTVPATESPAGPGPLLGIYRQGMSCPDSFQLLLTDPANQRLRLAVPSEGLDLPWLDAPFVGDLVFLPRDNTLAGNETVVLSEQILDGQEIVGNRITLVGVDGLYTEGAANPGFPPPVIPASDSLGDTLGSGDIQHDLVALGVFLQEDATTAQSAAAVFMQEDGTTPEPGIQANFALHFAGSVIPNSGESGFSLLGFIDFDTDQDPETGATSVVERFSRNGSRLGVDFRIDLGGYDEISSTVPLWIWTEEGFAEYGLVPVRFRYDVPFAGSTMELELPWQDFDPDGLADLAIMVGTPAEWTDIAPNGGFLTTGRAPDSGGGASLP